MNKRRLGAVLFVLALSTARLPATDPRGVSAPPGASLSAGFLYGFLAGPIASESPYAYPPGIGAQIEYAPPLALGAWEPFLAVDLRYHEAASLEPGYFDTTRFILPGIHLGIQRTVASFEDGRIFALAGRLGYIQYLREHIFLGSTYRGSRPALSLEGSLRARGPGPFVASFGFVLDLVLDDHPYLVPGLVAGLAYRRELKRDAR